MILQLGQDGPKIQLSLWVCDSFSWLWTFSLVMKHFLSKILFDYHFPPINLFLNLFDKISNFVLSDSSEPRNLLLWINHFSVTCDSLKVGLIARQQLTDLTQVLADWFFTPCVKTPAPILPDSPHPQMWCQKSFEETPSPFLFIVIPIQDMFVPLYNCNCDQMLVGPQASLITLKCSEHPDWKLATTDRPRDKHCRLGMFSPPKKWLFFITFAIMRRTPPPSMALFSTFPLCISINDPTNWTTLATLYD